MKNQNNDTFSLAHTTWKCQEKEDMISAQVGMVEYYDPFKEWLESYVKEQRK